MNYKATSTGLQFREYLLTFSSAILSAVVQHLLNLSFWVTSLQANDESFYFGKLTTNLPQSLTIENFAELIDSGTPSPSESG